MKIQFEQLLTSWQKEATAWRAAAAMATDDKAVFSRNHARAFILDGCREQLQQLLDAHEDKP